MRLFAPRLATALVLSLALITHAELKLYEIIGGLMVIGAAILEGSRNEQPAIA